MKSACIALLLVLPLCAGAATFYVDDDAPADPGPRDPNVSDPNQDGSTPHPFDSIQEAIDTALDGDTIIVSPGHYLSPDPWAYEEINFNGKNIRLVSRAPTFLECADDTVLCGVVIFRGDEDPNCLLQGFKVQNHYYGGILGNHTRATISHCIVSGNGPCGATVLKDVRGRVVNCLIVDNTTFHACGVLATVSGCPTLINCTIANNASSVYIGCAGPPKIDKITIRNCIIYGNHDDEQVHISDTVPSTPKEIAYNLIENWDATPGLDPTRRVSTLLDGDPCFVRPGYWGDPPAEQRSGSSPPGWKSTFLFEGDYHLQSEGWRWSSQRMHGSYWHFDTVTSPAVDAGDPMDSLGEEPERVPVDPEASYGFNHAIDLGAYGGTREASMSPTSFPYPPLSAAELVSLQDFWPLRVEPKQDSRSRVQQAEYSQWFVRNPQGAARKFLAYPTGHGNLWVAGLETTNAPDWAPEPYFIYTNDFLYLAQDAAALDLLPMHWNLDVPIPAQLPVLYPLYFTVGSTIEVPYDPLVKGTLQYRSARVVRGALTKVLAGTSVDPNQLLAGAWPDVIALKEINADGTIGDPIIILARGFGPLLFAGQPVEGAVIGERSFGTAHTQSETPPTAVKPR